MRAVFIGVVSIGRECLKALLEVEAQVVGVITADKNEMVKKSSMRSDYFSEFDDLAAKYNIPLTKVSDASIPLDMENIKRLEPDIIFCIGWPQIVGKELLEIPKYGCVGIHPTLLPKRRGGAPLNWCLIDGLSKSGVTLFYFDEGVDSGDIIARKEFDITPEDTAQTLLNLVISNASLLVRTYYPLLEKGKAPRIQQDHSRATYTRRRRPEEGGIKWAGTSLSVYNWIRALTLPFPGAFTYWKEKRITVWDSELPEGYRGRLNAVPGEVVDILEGRGMVVATADNCILVKTVEIDGQGMAGDELARTFAITTGAEFGGKQK